MYNAAEINKSLQNMIQNEDFIPNVALCTLTQQLTPVTISVISTRVVV